MKSDDDNNKKKIRLTLLDNVNVCLESFGDHVMHLVFSPTFKLDIGRFNRALRLSLDAEPILGCRLVDNTLRPYWTRWSAADLDRFELCRVETAESVDEQIQQFLLQNMNCRIEPMVQARVFRGTQDTVCLNVSCVPIDGRGLLIYLERLFEIYNQLEVNPGYTPTCSGFSWRSVDALVPYFRVSDAFKLIFFGLRNQWKDKSTARNWKFPVKSASSMDRTFYHYQFNANTLDLIDTYRQRHNVTFNDILLAAFYHSLQQIVQPESGTVCCVLNTYDLRRYEGASGPDRVANYSSFINSNVRLDRGMPFDLLIQRVRTAMADRKRHYPGATEGPFIWPIFKVMPFAWAKRLLETLLQHRGESIPVLTNVGVINVDRLSLDGAPLQWLLPYAPLEYPPKLTVTLATVGRRVTLSLGYSRNHFSPEHVHALFGGMEQIIVSSCKADLENDKNNTKKTADAV